ncbi:MAG: type III toxin-antitoxin system ToxN/AbiQ family toxin [Lachnospiraceae bacterium]|nr:type III toxin-antitoxin system ToxN/AbiQ family toxin [Lachnospiraceae bacterium]
MGKVGIYSVSDRYIAFLRSDPRLRNVFDNKEGTRSHTRKYLGIVFIQNGFHYYIPFSSPKNSDYRNRQDGTREIRKSIVPIIRMTTMDTATGNLELKGTLKLSNMIPVPSGELTQYRISDETDLYYKQVVLKEYSFITANISMIIKNANVIYRQKTNADKLFGDKNMPKYIENTVDFKYAESKCREFESMGK